MCVKTYDLLFYNCDFVLSSEVRMSGIFSSLMPKIFNYFLYTPFAASYIRLYCWYFSSY